MLEANIVENGCLSPLIVWEQENVLLDGHNRKEICERRGIPFEVRPLSLPDRQSAIRWILDNQLGRRNLTPDQFRVLLGERYLAEKQQGRRTDITYPHIGEKSITAERIASDHGVSKNTVERAAAVVRDLPLKEKQAIMRGEKTLLQAKREQKEARREATRAENAAVIKRAPSLEVVSSVFSTIVIDPPWDWSDEGDADQLGRSRPDYATMTIDQIAALPVSRLAAQDAHLYLWITNRSLPKGFALLDAWGFRYITALTWVKPHYGMGNYFRGQTEHVLFGVRGSLPLKRKDVGTVFHAPRGSGGHSSKPSEFLDIVESCSPGPYLEMFSRAGRDGWTRWGQDA